MLTRGMKLFRLAVLACLLAAPLSTSEVLVVPEAAFSGSLARSGSDGITRQMYELGLDIDGKPAHPAATIVSGDDSSLDGIALSRATTGGLLIVVGSPANLHKTIGAAFDVGEFDK